MLLTDENFDEAIASNELILVDFWADWCGPCKKLSPILDEIEAENPLVVGKLNVDANQNKPKEYGVVSIPTLVLFKNGEPVYTITGAKPKHALIKDLEKWF